MDSPDHQKSPDSNSDQLFLGPRAGASHRPAKQEHIQTSRLVLMAFLAAMCAGATGHTGPRRVIPKDATTTVTYQGFGTISASELASDVSQKCGSPFARMIYTHGQFEQPIQGDETANMASIMPDIHTALRQGDPSAFDGVFDLMGPFAVKSSARSVPKNAALHPMAHVINGREFALLTAACTPSLDPKIPLPERPKQQVTFSVSEVFSDNQQAPLIQSAIDGQQLRRRLADHCRDHVIALLIPIVVTAGSTGKKPHDASLMDDAQARAEGYFRVAPSVAVANLLFVVDDWIGKAPHPDGWVFDGRPVTIKRFMADDGRSAAAIAAQCLRRVRPHTGKGQLQKAPPAEINPPFQTPQQAPTKDKPYQPDRVPRV